jgi:hypothetical protein
MPSIGAPLGIERAELLGKTGAAPYFLFSENRELYRLFRATGWE